MNALLACMEVRRIPLDLARLFIEFWHYTYSIPTGKNLFFGWYEKDFEILYAVAAYGIGFNPKLATFLSKQTNLDVTRETTLELRRLCRREPKNEKLPLSAFLSRCHKYLKQQGYRYIISYSNPEQGHSGGVYVASGFTHLGKTEPQYHVIDRKGKVMHRRCYYRYAERKGISHRQAREELGLTILRTAPKDRWFLAL